MDTEAPVLSDSSEDVPEVDSDSDADIKDKTETLKKDMILQEGMGDTKIESDVKTSQETEKLPEAKGEETKSTISSSEYDPKNVHYEGDLAIYTDPKSGYQYKWCKETNEWLPKGGVTYGFEDDVHTYTDNEGVKYFWDVDKSAWFPKIDDDFMARYQMSYGFVDNTSTTSEDAGKKAKKMEEDDDDKEEDEEEVEKKIEKGKGVKRKGEVTPASKFFLICYLI